MKKNKGDSMVSKVNTIKYNKRGGIVYITVSFVPSFNEYECYTSVDEIIVKSTSSVLMNWDTEFDRIRWDEIKKEVAWCKEHFETMRSFYNDE